MKKTIIAAAIATVVAAPAMADVSISGQIEQTFTDTEGTGQWQGSTDNNIKFAASEDLGNGMTAVADFTLDVDSTDDEYNASAEKATTNNLDAKVGLKGSFGTVVMGRMEDFTESKAMSMMTLNGTLAVEATGNATRLDDAIAYVSPSFNGLTVGVAGYMLPTAATSGAGIATADDDAFDATDIMISYANGPLNVILTQEKANAEAADDYTIGKTTTSLGASYAAGDLKVSALFVDREDLDNNSTYDTEDAMYRVDYTMGANKITIAHLDDETNSSTGTTGTDVTAFEVTHSFSNRTSVYVGATDEDGSNNDDVYVGMIHKF